MRDRGENISVVWMFSNVFFAIIILVFFCLCADLGLVDILNEASHSLSSWIECQLNHFGLPNGKF